MTTIHTGHFPIHAEHFPPLLQEIPEPTPGVQHFSIVRRLDTYKPIAHDFLALGEALASQGHKPGAEIPIAQENVGVFGGIAVWSYGLEGGDNVIPHITRRVYRDGPRVEPATAQMFFAEKYIYPGALALWETKYRQDGDGSEVLYQRPLKRRALVQFANVVRGAREHRVQPSDS